MTKNTKKRKLPTMSNKFKKKQKLEETPPIVPAEELKCCVCWELKLGSIFQCHQCHLLCKDCHNRIINSASPSCPLCKERLCVMNPTRNRFAEKYLATIQTECTNEGCKVRLPFGQLEQHLKEHCKFRRWECKYRTLGCSWTGVYHERKKHKANCKIRNLGMSRKHLNLLNEGAMRTAKAKKEALEKTSVRNALVIKLLSSRARNVVVRDITIALDDRSDRMISGEWQACRSYWIATMEAISNPHDSQIGIRFEMAHHRKQQNLQMIVLPGPQFGISFPPVVFKAKFKPGNFKSPLFVLPISKEDAKRLTVSKEPINVRCIFINVNQGMDPEFSSDTRFEIDDISSDNSDSSHFPGSELTRPDFEMFR